MTATLGTMKRLLKNAAEERHNPSCRPRFIPGEPTLHTSSINCPHPTTWSKAPDASQPRSTFGCLRSVVYFTVTSFFSDYVSIIRFLSLAGIWNLRNCYEARNVQGRKTTYDHRLVNVTVHFVHLQTTRPWIGRLMWMIKVVTVVDDARNRPVRRCDLGHAASA